MASLHCPLSGHGALVLLLPLLPLGALLSAAQADCGHPHLRVVGGLPAAERKWPWQASLQIGNNHLCGGSLINHWWVLTAAHCIHGFLNYTVKLGDIHVSHKSHMAVSIPVRDIVIHKYFSMVRKIKNDIALVLLEFPVNYTTHIQPVCLPEKTFLVPAETECWVTGWGLLAESGSKDTFRPMLLQEADLKIIHHEKCNRILKKYVALSGSLVQKGAICAYSNRGKSSCQGDSGGPLVCELNHTWMQVGIVSWGIGCGYPGVPTVYTEVSYYRDWLAGQMNQTSSLDPGTFLILLLLLLVLPLGSW